MDAFDPPGPSLPGLAGTLLDVLAPARCHHCGRPTDGGPFSPCLCRACGVRVAAGAGPLPLPVLAGEATGRCLGELVGPLRTLVHAAKYRGNLAAGRRLGRALGSGPLPAADGLVPVPLHWRRRWLRGHDQARVLAAGIAGAASLPCRPILRRRRATRPQVGLGHAARARNLRGAFALRRRRARDLRGFRALLVDDVITTGATLRAAAAALRRRGVRVVGVLAAAWMPPPG